MESRIRVLYAGLAVLFAVVSGTGMVLAAISFDKVTWDSGSGEHNWRSLDGGSTVANADGYLGIEFDTAGLPGMDRVVNSADYTGNFTPYRNLQVSFQYLGYTGLGATQSIFFESDAGTVWEYLFTPSGHTWEPWTISFATSNGWNRSSGGEDFFSALTDVSLVGLAILTPGVQPATYSYGLDDWQFSDPVPEPGAMAMLATALVSMGLTVRRRWLSRLRAAEPLKPADARSPGAGV